MRIRQVAAIALAGALGTIGVGLPAAPALAATCTPASHCYGEVEWTSAEQVYGISETLNVSCLGPMNAPTSRNFVTEEQWLTTAENTVGNYWVELGMAYGAPQGSSRYFFWADQRPGGGYHEHDLSISANFHQDYGDEIEYAGNNSWTVSRDGTVLGTSTHNIGPSYSANTGEELTANTGEAAATMSDLTHKHPAPGGPAWIADWPGGSVSTADPPYGSWITQDSSADFYSNCSFAAADPGPVFTPFSAGQAKSSVARIAAGLAAANGENAPRSTQYTATRRQDAEGLTSQARVDSDQPVYLVTMRGDFVGDTAKVPRGRARPTGTVLSATIDPATGRILDWSITDSAPALSRLGPVTHVG